MMVLELSAMKNETRMDRGCCLLLAMLLSSMAALAGCSRFEKDWIEAGQEDYVETNLAGRWMGTWTSESDGKSGELRCIIKGSGAGAHRAAFRSTYGSMFRFDHSVTLYAVNLRGMWTFEGNEDLGLFAGGVYTYKGKAGKNKLFSTYESRRDQGTFEMYRVKKDDPPTDEKTTDTQETGSQTG